MIECCNVAKCDSQTKTCSVGYHPDPIKFTGGEEHMVRERKSRYLQIYWYLYILVLRLFFLLILHVHYKDDIEFEELDGIGRCSNSGGFYQVARTNYKSMSHEEAREICRLDDGCVAYSYSLDNYVAKSGVSTIMFTTTHCNADCGDTSWHNDPSLIKKASNPDNNPSWVTGKCYVKRNAADIMQKCINPMGK